MLKLFSIALKDVSSQVDLIAVVFCGHETMLSPTEKDTNRFTLLITFIWTLTLSTKASSASSLVKPEQSTQPVLVLQARSNQPQCGSLSVSRDTRSDMHWNWLGLACKTMPVLDYPAHWCLMIYSCHSHSRTELCTNVLLPAKLFKWILDGLFDTSLETCMCAYLALYTRTVSPEGLHYYH